MIHREGLSAQSLYGFKKQLCGGEAVLRACLRCHVATVQVTRSSVPCELAFTAGVTLRLEQLPDPGWLIAVLGLISARQQTAVAP